MSIASSIALSGMNVAALRLQVSASNVANLLTDGPLSGSPTIGQFPSAYAPLRVSQTSTIGGGTAATIGLISPNYVQRFDPTASYADINGMVASPNIDLANELFQQFLARYTFAANAAVVRTDAYMTPFNIIC
jgi:flagellar basal-body rod protein FlgC